MVRLDLNHVNRNLKKISRDPKLFVKDFVNKRVSNKPPFRKVLRLITKHYKNEADANSYQELSQIVKSVQVKEPVGKSVYKEFQTLSENLDLKPINLTDYNNQLYQFTKRYNVNSFKLGDEYIWPYIRNHMLVNLYATWRGRESYKQLNPLALSTAHFSKFTQYTRDYSMASIDAKPFDNLENEEADILFICQHSGFGRTEIDGEIYHRLIDPLFEAASTITSSKKIEFISNPNTNFIDIWHKYKYKTLSILPPEFQKVGYYNRCTYDESFFINFKGLFKTQIPVNRHILNSVVDYEMHTREWMLTVLKQIKPKVIFLTSFHYHASLISAADELGILTIDIQHGLQAGDGILYNHHEEIPEKGYQSYPDYFAVWGNKELKNIERNFPNKGHKAILLGNPWLDKLEEFEYEFPSYVTEKLDSEKRLIGLIVLQDQEKIQDLYKNIIKSTEDQVFWLVRHHPTSRKFFKAYDFINGLINDQVLIDESIDQANITALFDKVNFTLSEGSALAYEASQYGIKNFVFSDYAAKNFSDEIETDSFYYIDDVDSFNSVFNTISFDSKVNEYLPFANVNVCDFIKETLEISNRKNILGSPFVFTNEILIKQFQDDVGVKLDLINNYLADGYKIKAVEVFYELRELLGQAPAITKLCENEHEYFAKESRIFKNIINSEFGEENEDVFMVADSLGLPRPNETVRDDFGAKTTTAWHFNQNAISQINGHKMGIWAQRYLTTSRLIDSWSKIVGHLDNKHLIVHLGLNDSSERIFLEHQRLGMDMLELNAKKEIIDFGRKYRKHIISNQHDFNYVSPEQFRRNLQEIINLANEEGAKSISFVNIISFPKSHEINTPRSLSNTKKYNKIISNTVDINDNVSLIDLENMFIQKGKGLCMLEDNMHLSPIGHEVLADEIINQLDGVVKSEFTIAIIGVGQLGSRYLQGIKKINLKNSSLKVQLIENDEKARALAINRFNEIVENLNTSITVEFCEDIASLSNSLDLVVIATAAGIRAEILRELLLQKQVKNLVLEKVLFQKPEDYIEFRDKFSNLDINVWVNHPRREFSFYKNIVGDISKSKFINFSVSGTNWGLACNGLHFLDLILFLQQSKSEQCPDVNLNIDAEQVLPAKRKGCYEIFGNLNGKIGKASVNLDCRHTGDNRVDTIININTDTIRFCIDEARGEVSYASITNDWEWLQEKIAIIEHQSDLTPHIVEDILVNSRCNLPTYKDACLLHEPFIEVVLGTLKSEVNDTITTCLIS